MQPSPSFSIELRHFGSWRVAVWAVAALALAALGAWSRGLPAPVAGASGWAAALAASVVAVAILSSRSLRPLVLRWDGRGWHLGVPHTSGSESWTGQLTVAMDLGGWLLLRFRCDARAGWPRTWWLPVGRRGIHHQWHALRCAVYSPRPANDGFADPAS